MTRPWYHPALGVIWSEQHPAGIEPLVCDRIAIRPEQALALSDLDMAHLARSAGVAPSPEMLQFGRALLSAVAHRLDLPTVQLPQPRQSTAQPAQ